MLVLRRARSVLLFVLALVAEFAGRRLPIMFYVALRRPERAIRAEVPRIAVLSSSVFLRHVPHLLLHPDRGLAVRQSVAAGPSSIQSSVIAPNEIEQRELGGDSPISRSIEQVGLRDEEDLLERPAMLAPARDLCCPEEWELPQSDVCMNNAHISIAASGLPLPRSQRNRLRIRAKQQSARSASCCAHRMGTRTYWSGRLAIP